MQEEAIAKAMQDLDERINKTKKCEPHGGPSAIQSHACSLPQLGHCRPGHAHLLPVGSDMCLGACHLGLAGPKQQPYQSAAWTVQVQAGRHLQRGCNPGCSGSTCKQPRLCVTRLDRGLLHIKAGHENPKAHEAAECVHASGCKHAAPGCCSVTHQCPCLLLCRCCQASLQHMAPSCWETSRPTKPAWPSGTAFALQQQHTATAGPRCFCCQLKP